MSTIFGPVSEQLVALGVVLTRVEDIERRRRRLEADRLQALADAFDIAAVQSRFESSTPRGARAELAYRSVRAELATALRQSEAATEKQLSHAVSLIHDYRETFEALRDGSICERHASVIVEAGTVVGGGDSPDAVFRRASYETAALEVALVETPNRLRPIARRLAEQFAETSLDERHAEACERRRVFLVDGHDGMTDLIAHLPSVQARAIYERLTEMGRRLERVEGDSRAGVSGVEQPAPRRSRDQLRADLLADLLLTAAADGVGTGEHAVRAHVQVIVCDETLFSAVESGGGLTGGGDHGYDDGDYGAPTSPPPAEVAGCGPIGAEIARRLAASAPSWQLVRQHPATGAVLSVERYRPSEAMRRLLAARDLHCRFPGCRAPVHRCDLDHTIDAARGGPTSTDNLAHLCRGHHLLKHHGGWGVEQRGDGDLEWCSPTGRRYRDRPPSRVRFLATARPPWHQDAQRDPPSASRRDPRASLDRESRR